MMSRSTPPRTPPPELRHPSLRRKTDYFLGKVQAPATRTQVAVLFILMAITTAVIWQKVSGDEHKSCTIQARGLQAAHELTLVIGGIKDVLSFPPTSEEQKQRTQIDPQQLARELQVINNLRIHARRYFQLQAGQPTTRNC